MNTISVKRKMSFKEKLQECSKQLIEIDGKTLVNLGLSVKDGVFMLSLLPYFALYCRSAQEFFGERIIDNDTDRQINDLRNGLKLYSEKYNKSKDATLNSDEQQNNIFKNMFRFKFMQDWNIHYNLGVYIDMEGHIIGDTQFLNYFLNIPSVDIEVQNERAYAIGEFLGKKTAYILNAYFGIKNIHKYSEINMLPKYGYIDMNTNIRHQFFNKDVGKELNLIILHILSSIGFVNNMLCNLMSDDNLWLNRIKYISAHYAWSGLKKVKQHFDNEKQSVNVFSENINQFIKNGSYLFPSNFRNCMMHYDFCNKGTEVIMEKNFSDDKPFFGLIESCFGGKSYSRFFSELSIFLNDLEKYLLSWFNVDMKKVKWDL